jgi:Pup amidohydrolase
MISSERRTAAESATRRPHNRMPKLIGSDVELGNFLEGSPSRHGSGREASRLLLHEVPGIPATNDGYKSDSLSQDWGRKFLPANGGCIYIDLDHLELCTPEVTSAFDYVAAWHAMLLIARQAQQQANARAPAGRKVHVLINNSDGLGNSYGGHLNFLVSRRTWDDLFYRKLHYQALLASYQVTSMVFTGQGKVGAENGAPAVAYQISQRADFFETMTGLATTHRRPLVNSRDEPLCGLVSFCKGMTRRDSAPARLHCIFYDSNLCHVACLLKAGMMQIVLAMFEAGRMPGRLILDDPLRAATRLSHDPTLRAKVRTACGKRFTAVEWQLLLLEKAQRFMETGGCEGVVPRAQEILAVASDTLEKLQGGNLPALAGRLDWILKMLILQRAIEQHPGLKWDSLEMKHLDHLYSSLDPDEGLYWLYEKAGAVDRVATPVQIERFACEPPQDTRAFTRAMLLRMAGPKGISRMDWDYITIKVPSRWSWSKYRTLEMPDPLGQTRQMAAPAFESSQNLDEALSALESSQAPDTEPSHSQGERSDAIPQPSP